MGDKCRFGTACRTASYKGIIECAGCQRFEPEPSEPVCIHPEPPCKDCCSCAKSSEPAVEKEGQTKRITGAPFYPLYYVSLAKTCREHGYALAVHGSMIRDLDLVAIPWTEEASPEEVLIRALIKNHGLMEGNLAQKEKPHGRKGYVFIGFGGEETGYIDLSVISIRQKSRDERWENLKRWLDEYYEKWPDIAHHLGPIINKMKELEREQ